MSEERGTMLALHCRRLRRQRSLTLDDVARRSGFTKSYLSKVERGLTVPSVMATERMARAFEVSVGALLGEPAGDDGVHLGRVADRRRVVRRGSKVGYTFELISRAAKGMSMEAYMMRPPRKLKSNVWFEHEGGELIYVLRGRVAMEFTTRSIVLNPGDCVYLEAHVRHRSQSLGATPAEALSVHMYGREDRPAGPLSPRPARRGARHRRPGPSG